MSQNFISENKEWNIVIKTGFDGIFRLKTYSFKFMGDTTLDEINCHKLYFSDDNGENWRSQSFWHERNDSVFLYLPRENGNILEAEDILIYNFNIQEKDSFYNHTSQDYIYVDSVRTKMWGNSERKIIYFSSKQNAKQQTKWIQGVGNDGLIYLSSEIGSSGGTSSILCFYENGEQVYQNADYNSCFISNTGVDQFIQQPNLVETIQIENDLLEISASAPGTISIFTPDGKLLQSRQIDTNKIQLSLSIKGMLIYRFTTKDGKVQTGKVQVK